MAFDKTNWRSGLTGSNAPAIHTYKSADTAATVNTAGYFNDVYNEVALGDIIYAFLDTGGTPQGYWLAINGRASSVVDVTDGLAVGTTDTD